MAGITCQVHFSIQKNNRDTTVEINLKAISGPYLTLSYVVHVKQSLHSLWSLTIYC